jgi:hypothetical protein
MPSVFETGLFQAGGNPSQYGEGGPQQMSIRVSRWKKQLSSNSCERKFMVSTTMVFQFSTHHAIASQRSRPRSP